MVSSYNACVKEAGKDKGECLVNEYNQKYLIAKYKHTSLYRIDGDDGCECTKRPFFWESSDGQSHGEVCYAESIESIAERHSRKPKDKLIDVPKDFRGYLEIFDSISERHFKDEKTGRWEVEEKNWRSIDYYMEEPSISMYILNGEFFCCLAHLLLRILDRAYFWNEDYFAVVNESRKLKMTKEIEAMVKQSYPLVAGEVNMLFSPNGEHENYDSSQMDKFWLEKPSDCSEELIRKQNMRVIDLKKRKDKD